MLHLISFAVLSTACFRPATAGGILGGWLDNAKKNGSKVYYAKGGKGWGGNDKGTCTSLGEDTNGTCDFFGVKKNKRACVMEKVPDTDRNLCKWTPNRRLASLNVECLDEPAARRALLTKNNQKLMERLTNEADALEQKRHNTPLGSEYAISDAYNAEYKEERTLRDDILGLQLEGRCEEVSGSKYHCGFARKSECNKRSPTCEWNNYPQERTYAQPTEEPAASLEPASQQPGPSFGPLPYVIVALFAFLGISAFQ